MRNKAYMSGGCPPTLAKVTEVKLIRDHSIELDQRPKHVLRIILSSQLIPCPNQIQVSRIVTATPCKLISSAMSAPRFVSSLHLPGDQGGTIIISPANGAVKPKTVEELFWAGRTNNPQILHGSSYINVCKPPLRHLVSLQTSYVSDLVSIYYYKP